MTTSPNVRVEGGLFSDDLLSWILSLNTQDRNNTVPGLTEADYFIARPQKLRDTIQNTYSTLQGSYSAYRSAYSAAGTNDDRTRINTDWVIRLLQYFQWTSIETGQPVTIEGRTYKRSHKQGKVPILVAPTVERTQKHEFDEPVDGFKGTAFSNLEGIVRYSTETNWGILANGALLRLVYKNRTFTQHPFIEFDVEAILSGDDLPGFTLLFLLVHASRFQPDAAGQRQPWLDEWLAKKDLAEVAALQNLHGSVVTAIRLLAAGFLRHADNDTLRANIRKADQLQPGKAPAADEETSKKYYQHVLRLIYRLIFLFVAEDRDLLHHIPDKKKREVYEKYYSTRRLRESTVTGSNAHHDLWKQLQVVFDGLTERGIDAIALPALNGPLWRPDFIGPLAQSNISNQYLLKAIRALSHTGEKGLRRPINFRTLGSEELGSVYERLLGIEPHWHGDEKRQLAITPEERKDGCELCKKNEDQSDRKKSGSHYTPNNLIELLLRHTIDPALDERILGKTKDEAVKAILAMTVVDPTCGSGHFLVAAGRRMGRRLAEVRFGPEPTNEQIRDCIRDVVGRCLYGVDLNEMATEIAKVALWLEAMEPGKPLTFLEHHIKCGNALLGCFESELKNGIPDEAYKPRPENKKSGFPGDDPEACKVLKKRNEQTRKNQQLTSFDDDFKQVQEVLTHVTQEVDALDGDTVVGIRAKENLYYTGFRGTDEYVRMRRAMDAWCAAFTYRKWRPQHPANLTSDVARDALQAKDLDKNDPDPLHPESGGLIEDEARAGDNAFFHWEIEFPQVLRKGGFDVVLGNPPYKGGSLVSGALGHHYNHLFVARWPWYQTKADLASGFLLQSWKLAGAGARLGLITTNTIGKNETSETGLAHLILNEHATITAAYPDIAWPGDANVVVAAIALSHTATDRRVFRGEGVGYISSKLDLLPERSTVALPARKNKSFKGDMPGGPFDITPLKAQEWLAADAKNAEVLTPYLSAEDLLQRPDQQPTRWTINFHRWPIERAKAFTLPFQYVESTVKPFRDTVNREATRERWWQYKEYSAGMRKVVGADERIVVKPAHTETPLFIAVPNQYVVGNSAYVIKFDGWFTVGELNSCIHEVWFRKQGSGMKHDARYTPNSCFETFPVPARDERVGDLGKAFHEHVLAVSQQRGVGLTDVWNLVNRVSGRKCERSSCTESACPTHALDSPDIQRVRDLRSELTVAVGRAFEWKDWALGDYEFGVHEDNAGRNRFTVSPRMRDAIYARLLDLNAKQAQSVSPHLEAQAGSDQAPLVAQETLRGGASGQTTFRVR